MLYSRQQQHWKFRQPLTAWGTIASPTTRSEAGDNVCGAALCHLGSMIVLCSGS
jgi:hypothetical protein